MQQSLTIHIYIAAGNERQRKTNLNIINLIKKIEPSFNPTVQNGNIKLSDIEEMIKNKIPLTDIEYSPTLFASISGKIYKYEGASAVIGLMENMYNELQSLSSVKNDTCKQNVDTSTIKVKDKRGKEIEMTVKEYEEMNDKMMDELAEKNKNSKGVFAYQPLEFNLKKKGLPVEVDESVYDNVNGSNIKQPPPKQPPQEFQNIKNKSVEKILSERDEQEEKIISMMKK